MAALVFHSTLVAGCREAGAICNLLNECACHGVVTYMLLTLL